MQSYAEIIEKVVADCGYPETFDTYARLSLWIQSHYGSRALLDGETFDAKTARRIFIHLVAISRLTTLGEKYREWLASPRWAELREKVFARDGRACKFCGSDKDLQVHHRDYGRGWDCIDKDVVVVVCRRCHRVIHGKKV